MNTPTITVRVKQEVQDALKDEAKARGVTLSDVVNERLQGAPVPTVPFVPENGNVPCPHPDDQQREVAGGTLCLVCKIVRSHDR